MPSPCPRLLARLALFLLAPSASGCESIAGTPTEASALCDEVARIVCAADERCFDGSGGSTCETAQSMECEETLGTLAADNRLGYDAARAGAFLAALEESAAGCWEAPIDHDAMVAVFGGTGVEGADCTPAGTSLGALRVSALSCSGETTCRLHLRTDGSPEGVCERRTDDACSHPLDCEAGMYCSLPARWQPGVWGACRPGRPEGLACASELECESLFCGGECGPRPRDRLPLEVGYATLVESDGPSMYLRLNESSGARSDALGGPAAAAVGGAVMRESRGALEGDTDGAARFGGGGFLRAPVPDALAESDALTLECWLRADDTMAARPILEIADSMRYGPHVWTSEMGDTLYANFVDAEDADHGVMSDAGAIEAEQWHHVVASYDGERGVLYLDGARIAEVALSGPLRLEGDLYLGHRNMMGEAMPVDFVGAIDEVALYDHALTAEDAARHHEAGVEGALANRFALFGWLR